MDDAADIRVVAEEFIEVNERRKELEKREDSLKEVLVRYFEETGERQLDTDRGTVSYLESKRVEYDIPSLRRVLPPHLFELVTKVSVNDSILSQLAGEGKVDAAAVEQARKVTIVHRVVAQARPVSAAPAAPADGTRAVAMTASPAPSPSPASKPSGPAKPAKASGSASAKPSRPAKSSKPTGPAKPAHPAHPAQPARPPQPAQPAQPAEPAQPAKPARPPRPARSAPARRPASTR